MSARSALPLAAALLGCAAALPSAAFADGVTLSLEHGRAVHGDAVRANGALVPAAAGMTVVLRNAADEPVASAVTAADGTYSLALRARRSLELHATSGLLVSAAVKLRVRPRVRVTFEAASLFAPARLIVRVSPDKGVRVRASVVAGGAKLASRTSWSRKGRVELTVPIAPARMRAYVSADGDGLEATSRTVDGRARIVPLGPGSAGPAVAGLKRRLSELHFLMLDRSPRWSIDLADATLAFQKQQRMARTGVADATTLRRLATAKPEAARHREKGIHVEVDKTRQIFTLVRDGQPEAIIHISSGATGNTPVGHHHVLWKAPATSTWLGSAILYRTMTFHGGFAIHGFSPVPAYPASHGCVREPMWAADWMYQRVPVGSSVYVY